MTLALLKQRAAGATICPSEVAKAIAERSEAGAWRTNMPAVHAAVAGLVRDGLVRLSWRGGDRKPGEGPYRIGRPSPETDRASLSREN